MALLITTDNKRVFLPAETANLLWLVFTGERKGTPKTKAKVKQISKWYLNRYTAPPSYRDIHPFTSEPRRKPIPQLSLPYKD